MIVSSRCSVHDPGDLVRRDRLVMISNAEQHATTLTNDFCATLEMASNPSRSLLAIFLGTEYSYPHCRKQVCLHHCPSLTAFHRAPLVRVIATHSPLTQRCLKLGYAACLVEHVHNLVLAARFPSDTCHSNGVSHAFVGLISAVRFEFDLDQIS